MLLAAKSFVQTSGACLVMSSVWVSVDARWALPPDVTRLHMSPAFTCPRQTRKPCGTGSPSWPPNWRPGCCTTPRTTAAGRAT